MNIACDTCAIGPADRPHHRQLLDRIRAAIRGRTELPDGYTFAIDERTIGLPEIAQWIAMERLCCPFLKFNLALEGAQTDYFLTLTGPEGTKAVLLAEF